MIKIGIIGDFLKTATTISEILEKNSFSTKIMNYKNFFPTKQAKYDFLLIGIVSPYTSPDYIKKLKLDILIINDPSQITCFKSQPFIINQNGIILLNIDKEEKIELKNKTPFYVITFGFNQKATITVSSLLSRTSNILQVSIQRTIPTLTDKVILEQDFTVNTQNNNNILSILSAIGAILLSGVDIENI